MHHCFADRVDCTHAGQHAWRGDTHTAASRGGCTQHTALPGRDGMCFRIWDHASGFKANLRSVAVSKRADGPDPVSTETPGGRIGAGSTLHSTQSLLDSESETNGCARQLGINVSTSVTRREGWLETRTGTATRVVTSILQSDIILPLTGISWPPHGVHTCPHARYTAGMSPRCSGKP